MARKSMNVQEQQGRFVVAVLRGERSLSGLCREFGLFRPAMRRCLSRDRSGGIEAI
jgi:hypothetical protein